MKYLLVLVLLTLSLPANAAYVWHNSEIKTIYPLAGGAFVIIPQISADDCPYIDGYLYVEAGQGGVTQEAVKNYLSVALTAASLGKKVNIYFDKDGTRCYINRLSVSF